jgi:hypothetical protein
MITRHSSVVCVPPKVRIEWDKDLCYFT